MSEAAPPAARWEDLIAHNQSQFMRILGELLADFGSAWAAARVLRLFLALNPAGLAFFAASFILEYAISKAIDFAADKLGEAMEEPGEMGIKAGSNNVSINRRPAARGGKDGDPLKCHVGKKIIEGSKWVTINEKPAARFGDWTNDSGKIATASPNVFIGGPKVDADRESDWQKFIKWAYTAVDLRNKAEEGFAEFGKAVAGIARDQALDATWDFIKGD